MNVKQLALTGFLALALSNCGYFNSLYNARRQFADAERLRMRGDLLTARGGYIGSIEKAARSYRKYPTGRWADDALYLIARSRFQLGEYPAARAAFTQLLSTTSEAEIRAGAHAYAGAAALLLAEPVTAVMHLDSALLRLGDAAPQTGFAHLWRARARVATGAVAGAWADLDAVTDPGDSEYGAVQLERIALAIGARDSLRAGAAFAALLADRNVRRRIDTLSALAIRASAQFGASAARAMLAQPRAEWPDAPRDSLELIRARIAADAGDTLSANRELMQLAGRATGPTAATARVLVARARLRHVQDLQQLSAIRSLLLPAIAHADAQLLIRTIPMVQVLVQRSATTGQSVAIFTAAEIARDELGAPQLARKLFVTFADIAAQSPWAAKALLAAIAIAPADPETADLRLRLAALPANPYTPVTRGESASDAYDTAEERLARSMTALREEAAQLASQEGGTVLRAIAVLDSLTAAARTDTLRANCGMMLDTLALTGMRADSVRAACMRRDTTMVAGYLKIDTLAWLPGVAPDDSLRLRRRVTAPRPAGRDTIK
ncbi:MAG: hypothetical protein ACT4O1_01555 [Gemmatimonadota bacterium]